MAHCATLTIDPFNLPPLRSTQHCPRLTHTTSLPQSAHRLSIGTRSPFSVSTLHPPLASAPLLLVFAVHSPSCMRLTPHTALPQSPLSHRLPKCRVRRLLQSRTLPSPGKVVAFGPHSPLSQSPFQHICAPHKSQRAARCPSLIPRCCAPPHPGYTQRKV